MKTNTSILCRLAAVAALVLPAATLPSFGQTTATTDPVGFFTLTVNGGGSVTAPKLSLISQTLTQPVSWQGSITGISGTAITVASNSWTAGQFNGANGAFFVEITSTATPANSGAISDITATPTTSSITTFDNLSAFAAVGDTIKIRKHKTIADVFGATNSAGLLGSTSASSADEVLIYAGATQATYWYYDGSLGGAAGWYDLSFNPSGSVTIGPSEGIVIKRKAAANVSIVVQGAVKTGNTFFPIQNGFNVLGTTSAQGLTLGTSGLISGSALLKGATSASSADEVIIYSPTTQTNYWYYDGTLGGAAGWYDLNFNSSNNVSLSPGTSIVINRKGGGAFNWPLPAPSSF